MTTEANIDTAKEWDFPHLKKIIDDLLVHRPHIYYLDFGITIFLAWLCVGLSLNLPIFSVSWFGCFLVSSFSFYRGLVFIHEIAHFKPKTFIVFEILWNLLCGFALFFPTFTYRVPHRDHHSKETFATERDPRYLPLAYGKRIGLILPFFIFLIVPFVFFIRFVVLGVLSLLVKGKMRDVVFKYMSSLEMNFKYARPMPETHEIRSIVIQELGCAVYWIFAIVCVALGYLPKSFFVTMYLILYAVMCYNHYRALAAHLYQHSGAKVSFSDQLLDSITIKSPSIIDELFSPVGLAYHSLHHLFPSMPYHAMAEANKRLINKLPSDHPYLRTLRPSVFVAVKELWKECKKNE